MNTELNFIQKLRNKLATNAENNRGVFVFIMIIIINIAVIALSSTLLLFLPENKDRNFLEMMRFTFTLMVNPSGRYQYSDYPISLVFTSIVVLLGMISLTGGTVGFITSIITNVLVRSASSHRKLGLKKHIVILNYNHKVPSIIYDYCFDDIKNTYVVILSDKDKKYVRDQIDNLFRAHREKKKFKNIIIQTGSPFSQVDLDRIGLKHARTVLLMKSDSQENDSAHNNEETPEFDVLKLFMFINSYLSKNAKENIPCVISEVSNTKSEKLIRDYPFKVGEFCFPVNINELIGKIMAVTVVMPSLCDALLHLISFEGVEFYLEDIPESLSIEDELKSQDSAMPVLDTENKRIYIAENESLIKPSGSGKFVLKKPLPEQKLIPCLANDKPKLLIVGSNKKLSYILDGLVCFKKEFPDFKLTVVLMDIEENEATIREYSDNPEYRSLYDENNSDPIIVNDITEPFMREDGSSVLEDVNSILLLSDTDSSETTVDEKPLLFWNSLKRNDSENTHSCIVEVLDMQNESIIKKKNRDQVVVSERFISCLYAQLGKDPVRLDFIKDLVTSEGDDASINSSNELVNDCNLFSVRTSLFFKNYKGDLKFSSKRELILWVYQATDRNYLPIGCVKNNICYLFSRTEGKNDGLDTAILLPKDDGSDLKIIQDELTLEPEDEIIVIELISTR